VINSGKGISRSAQTMSGLVKISTQTKVWFLLPQVHCSKIMLVSQRLHVIARPNLALRPSSLVNWRFQLNYTVDCPWPKPNTTYLEEVLPLIWGEPFDMSTLKNESFARLTVPCQLVRLFIPFYFTTALMLFIFRVTNRLSCHVHHILDFERKLRLQPSAHHSSSSRPSSPWW
jgi:hypothetical protein